MLDDDLNTNDAHLKKFFKQQYGIDISENGDNLSADEKETLRWSKQYPFYFIIDNWKRSSSRTEKMRLTEEHLRLWRPLKGNLH